MIDEEARNYNKKDIGNSNYLNALESLQSWLEENGEPFESLTELDYPEDLSYNVYEGETALSDE